MSQNEETPVYRTLFLCTLVQASAFSSGGNESASLADMGLALDGEGRVVFRGSSLAGALLATARTFLDVPDAISRGLTNHQEDTAQPPSLWGFDHAHPWGDGALLDTADLMELRAYCAHRQDTRAAHSSGQFDLEALPRGLRWKFLLDITHPRNGQGSKAAAMAALALREWQRERCWLGRKVARGLGWMRLDSCHIVELPVSEGAIDAWPDSSRNSLEERYSFVESQLGELGNVSVFDSEKTLDDYLQKCESRAASARKTPTRAYLRWPLQIKVAPYQVRNANNNEISYGLDALSMQGHGSYSVDPDNLNRHLLRPVEQEWAKFKENFAPDNPLAMTKPYGSKQPEPVLAGSGISGALRHHLARSLRAAGTHVLDPATLQCYGARSASIPHATAATGDASPEAAEVSIHAPEDESAELFGAMGKDMHPSRLLIQDAHLVKESREDWKLALLEKVALDEFRQSAFPGAKFNRLAILAGEWEFDLVLEIRAPQQTESRVPTKEEWLTHIQESSAPVNALLEDAKLRRIGIGGGEFRSYGHVPIYVPEGKTPQWALAGEIWKDWPTQDGETNHTPLAPSQETEGAL
jgi:CRISPR/Cas system CSM-associated protein Csm3 (group 7 of RAMP superfamily)